MLNMHTEGISKSLLDTLAELYEQGHMTVRIGCSRGNNFVYIGPIAGIDFESINRKSLEKAKQQVKDAKDILSKSESALFAARSSSGLKKAEEKVQSARKKVRTEQDRLKPWAKYQDREVLIVYASTVDSDMIVIVDGFDGSVQYSVERSQAEAGMQLDAI